MNQFIINPSPANITPNPGPANHPKSVHHPELCPVPLTATSLFDSKFIQHSIQQFNTNQCPNQKPCNSKYIATTKHLTHPIPTHSIELYIIQVQQLKTNVQLKLENTKE